MRQSQVKKSLPNLLKRKDNNGKSKILTLCNLMQCRKLNYDFFASSYKLFQSQWLRIANEGLCLSAMEMALMAKPESSLPSPKSKLS